MVLIPLNVKKQRSSTVCTTNDKNKPKGTNLNVHKEEYYTCSRRALLAAFVQRLNTGGTCKGAKRSIRRIEWTENTWINNCREYLIAKPQVRKDDASNENTPNNQTQKTNIAYNVEL